MPKTSTTYGMNPLPSILRAAAWDAGNIRARKAGRTKWTRGDLEAAGDEQERLIRALFARATDTDPREAYCRFGHAEAMQKAGLLTVSTKRFHEEVDASWAAYVASLDQVAA